MRYQPDFAVHKSAPQERSILLLRALLNVTLTGILTAEHNAFTVHEGEMETRVLALCIERESQWMRTTKQCNVFLFLHPRGSLLQRDFASMDSIQTGLSSKGAKDPYVFQNSFPHIKITYQ